MSKLYRGPDGDSQGGAQPPGTSPRDEGTMIDDDFMRIVDRLFGRMMSDMLGMNPWGVRGTESDTRVEDSMEQSIEPRSDSDEKDGEMIDLADSILVVVDGVPDAAKIRAAVKNGQLTISIKGENEREISFDLPYHVSVKRSNLTVNNGVIEMHLPKILNNEKDIDAEGVVSPK